MDARNFLSSALKIVGGNQEVDYRNAVSRAYYGVFHVCKDLLEKLPNSPPQIGTSHQKLIDELLSHPDQRLKSSGNQLATARDCRTKADYFLGKKFSRYEAERLLIHTQKMLLAVDEYLSKGCD